MNIEDNSEEIPESNTLHENTSVIKAVTVYPDSAIVTRISSIALSVGDNDIMIENLPIGLIESSLRISGDAEGSVTLGSVELLRDIKTDVVQEKERKLRKKIEEKKDKRKEINDVLSRNHSQLQYIQKMALGNSTDPKVIENNHHQEQNGTYINLPLEQWAQAWQTLDSATSEVQEKNRRAESSLLNIDKELNKLDRELQQIAVNQSETRTAKLHVKSQKATKLTLQLTYQINGASWEAIYDADLDTKTSLIDLKIQAQISQSTGEDWKNVDVTLSTLRARAGTQLPLLNTWSIDLKQEQQVNIKSGDTSDSEMFAGSFGSDQIMTRSRKIAHLPSMLTSTDFSAEYKVPGTICLDSGSNKRRFTLSSQSFKSEITMASAPRLDPRVMILAKIKYTDEAPLLKGSLSLYRNGSFVGTMNLSQKQSGEEIKLSFGEDDKVKIKFLPDPDKKRKDGLLFGKKKVVERHYKLSISNNHNKSYPISLYDTFPVASHEDIKVVKTGDEPTIQDFEDKKGVASWDRILESKKEVKIKYGYTVSYPEDKTVTGL